MNDPEEPPGHQPWHPARDTRRDPFDSRKFVSDLPAWLWATRLPPMSHENQQAFDRFKQRLRTLH